MAICLLSFFDIPFFFLKKKQVKFKIATCHGSLGENRAALAEVCIELFFFLLQLGYVDFVNLWSLHTFYLYSI